MVGMFELESCQPFLTVCDTVVGSKKLQEFARHLGVQNILQFPDSIGQVFTGIYVSACESHWLHQKCSLPS